MSAIIVAEDMGKFLKLESLYKEFSKASGRLLKKHDNKIGRAHV